MWGGDKRKKNNKREWKSDVKWSRQEGASASEKCQVFKKGFWKFQASNLKKWSPKTYMGSLRRHWFWTLDSNSLSNSISNTFPLDFEDSPCSRTSSCPWDPFSVTSSSSALDVFTEWPRALPLVFSFFTRPFEELPSQMALNATQMAFVTFKCVSPAPSSPLSYRTHSTVICYLQPPIMQYWIISQHWTHQQVLTALLSSISWVCFPFCHHSSPNLSYSPLPNGGTFTLNPYTPVSSHRVTFLKIKLYKICFLFIILFRFFFIIGH